MKKDYPDNQHQKNPNNEAHIFKMAWQELYYITGVQTRFMFVGLAGVDVGQCS